MWITRETVVRVSLLSLALAIADGYKRQKREGEDFVCPQADGLFANPDSCKRFYMCNGYHPYSQNCPTSLYFDDTKKFCTRRTKQLICGPVDVPVTAPPPPDPNAATECDTATCQLPECFCSSDGRHIPGGLLPEETPQMILLTFDGALNALNADHFKVLLNRSRLNPNGCPIKGTFFVSHEYTSHHLVQKFYAEGHEIGVFSISNRYPQEWWSKASYESYVEEMVGQREILHKFSNLSRDSLLGMRAPFINPGGNSMLHMAYDYDFVYDSSFSVPVTKVPVWPYTLDHKIPHRCAQGNCNTRSFPGLWEIPLNTLYSEDGTGGNCALADQCVFQEGDDESVELFLKDNFLRHYDSNRAPLMFSFKVNWFNDKNKTQVLLNFVDELLTTNKDVWFVTMQELVTWMRNPTPLSKLSSFPAWGCEKRERACFIANNCPLPLVLDGFAETRYMQTCAKCPAKYPWVGNFEGASEGTKILDLTRDGEDQPQEEDTK